ERRALAERQAEQRLHHRRWPHARPGRDGPPTQRHPLLIRPLPSRRTKNNRLGSGGAEAVEGDPRERMLLLRSGLGGLGGLGRLASLGSGLASLGSRGCFRGLDLRRLDLRGLDFRGFRERGLGESAAAAADDESTNSKTANQRNDLLHRSASI